ncbi:MAG: hypothetical protein HRT72_13700, partial [Flavobacteriales bacterium]|nr:hypothetical protein [Flavobacteriales bacterium]
MNKLLYLRIFCLVLGSVFSSCANDPVLEEHPLEIDSIVVSYLDWNLKTRGALSCDDVRDFNDGKNDHYVVKDKEVIQHFVNALSLIQFKFIMTKEKSDTRMVLDFYSSDERIKEIGLNSRGAVFADKNLY